MPESPRLTVAIPTLNGARHLAEALRSILAQADVPFDLIVSDDRSDDDTLAVVRAEAGDRAQVEVNGERLGLAGNWNRCVERSRTPWVAIFHQDDVMRPGHLAAHLEQIKARPHDGFICGAAEVIDDQGRPVPGSIVERGEIGDGDRHFAPGAFVDQLVVKNPVRCSAVTLNAEAHAEVGGFDPSYRYVVDWDFWLRVARRRSVTWLARPTVAIRWHAASETHRFKMGTADLDEQVGLLKSSFRSHSRDVRREVHRRLGRAFLNRAYDSARVGDRALSRHCLRRAVSLWPWVAGRIAFDPRLMARLMLAGLSRPREPRTDRV